MAEVVVDLGGSLGLGFLIQWKQLVLRGWQLIDADSALMKDVLRHDNSRHCVRPPGVKRKLRDDLVRWGLHEASSIGICSRGAVSGVGRELLRGAGGSAQSLLAELLPEPVESRGARIPVAPRVGGTADHDISRADSRHP